MLAISFATLHISFKSRMFLGVGTWGVGDQSRISLSKNDNFASEVTTLPVKVTDLNH